jgi:hypothetical protein
MDFKALIARVSSMFHAPRDPALPADQPPEFSAMRVVFVVCSVLLVVTFLALEVICTRQAHWQHIADVGSSTGTTFGALLTALLGAKCYQCRCE